MHRGVLMVRLFLVTESWFSSALFPHKRAMMIRLVRRACIRASGGAAGPPVCLDGVRVTSRVSRDLA